MLTQIPTTAKYYPPRKFVGAERCSFVSFCDKPQFACTKGKERGSKRRGLLYQARVEKYLEEQRKDPWALINGPWIEYADAAGKFRYAQPDILAINPTLGRIVIVEIKLSRVPLAWWQLNRKYRPLVEALFPRWEIGMLEVVSQVYAVAVPESVKLVHRLEQVVPNETALMQVSYNV